MRADPSGPPRLANAIIEARLPEDLAEAIVGDLEHEYRTRIRPSRPRILADLWYWRQALSVRAGALRRAYRRVRAVRPTWDRDRPARTSHHGSTHWSDFPMQLDDFRYAFRRLVRSPGFTLVAVLTLGLGIGANTAMFSLVNAVLIRELPVTDPGRLVEVYTSDSGGFPHATSSQPDYQDLKEQATLFDGIVGARTFIARMDREGLPTVVFGELVSWDYFQTLGVRMALGRPFLSEEDETAGTHPVTILGHRTWVSEFASDPAVVGRTVRLNGRPYTVVGVAPEAFTGSMPVLVTGFYLPLMMTNEIMGGDQLDRRGSRSMFLKGRLAPGVTIEQANEELARIAASLAATYPETNEHAMMSALPSGDVALHPIVDRVLTPVAALLLGVVGLVLLIACANLASFLLARAEGRRKEIAVRLALGAGRGRLVRQLLVETVVLGMLGGLAGVLIANWTLGVLMAFQPPLPIPISLDIGLDRTVLLFTAGVSAFAGLAFGLAPALQATNPDIAPTLKNEGTAVSASRRRLDLRGGLVVAQVAFSFVLLIGAGLFVRSLQKAQLIDPGFDTGPGAVIWPMPNISGYDTDEEVTAFFNAFEERLLSHPGVNAVAMADRLPLGIAVQTGNYVIPGAPSESPDGDHAIDNANVSAGYFDAMGVSVLQGRGFLPSDVAGDGVVVVSEAFVRRFVPTGDPVGTVIQRGSRELRIVGVAKDTKVRTLGEAPRPYVYHLAGQIAGLGLQVVVKGDGDGPEMVGIARSVLRELDPMMALFEEPITMNEHLALLLFPPRMAAMLLSVFGGLALLLAAIGIYGLVSHAVAKRTRELGIRISLGASTGDVVRLAVGGGMRLVGIGAAIGVALAGAVTWALSRYLFGISPTDLATFVAIPLILGGVALVAAWFPARRAIRIDPVGALKAE